MRNATRRTDSIERLLDAALAILVERGYARFRVAEVATRSGMSEGSLFRYFPTKNDLVRAALERSLALHLERLATTFAALPVPTMTRRTMATALWEVLSHPEFAWTYELYAAAAYDPMLQAKLSDVLSAHALNIDSVATRYVVETGLIPADEVADAINLMTWSMQGLVVNDMVRGITGRHEALIAFLDSIASRLYGP